MKKRLWVPALVIAAVALLAVWSVAAAVKAAREGHAVVGLAEATNLSPASADAPASSDEFMDPEFGCGDRGDPKYEVDEG